MRRKKKLIIILTFFLLKNCFHIYRKLRITLLSVVIFWEEYKFLKRCSVHLDLQLFVGCSCLIYVICVCLRIAVSNAYCVLLLFCLSSSCVSYVASFSGLFFFIALSVFSNVFYLFIPACAL